MAPDIPRPRASPLYGSLDLLILNVLRRDGRLDRKVLAVVVTEDLSAVPAALERWSIALEPPRRLVFRFQPSRTNAGEILTAVRDAGLEIADLTTEEADLEAIFLRLTQSGADGEGETGVRGGDDPQAGPLSLSRTRPAP